MKIEDVTYAKPDYKDLDNAIVPPMDANGRLVIKLWPPDTTTDGGLVLPSNSQEVKAIAWVLKKSPDAAIEISVGDTVLFNSCAKTDLFTGISVVNVADVYLLFGQPKTSTRTEK